MSQVRICDGCQKVEGRDFHPISNYILSAAGISFDIQLTANNHLCPRCFLEYLKVAVKSREELQK